jgi:hypothetical protein
MVPAGKTAALCEMKYYPQLFSFLISFANFTANRGGSFKVIFITYFKSSQFDAIWKRSVT